jgi:SAM-dependent methyltransferase
LTQSDKNATAVHFKGGNLFDDIQIDIAASHKTIENLDRNTVEVGKSRVKNTIKFYFTGLALWLDIYKLFVVNGLCDKWFNDFRGYWSNILGGRPLPNTLDFFMLLHDYRKRQQHTQELEWSDPEHHLKNWQQPQEIYATFHYTRQLATKPIATPLVFWKHLSKNMRVLEYGCSLAPYYYCYRNYFGHLNCQWTLADIPNFPFHYSKYLYKNDPDLHIITINDTDFMNPLHDENGFDMIVLTTVMEHLNDPLFVSTYLLERLKPGGLFIFDYIKSDGLGLDHPKALEVRLECLKMILSQTKLVYGNVENLNESIDFCIVRKSA